MARRSTCEPCLSVGIVLGGQGIEGWAIGHCERCWGAATEEAYIEFHWPPGKIGRSAVLAFWKWLQERDA